MKTELTDRVAAALTQDDWATRSKRVAELKDQRPAETFAAVIGLLNAPDQLLRRRACGSLSRFRDRAVEQAETLASLLLHHADPVVRLSCGIAIMDVRTPAVDAAYLRAWSDPDEKVATMACWQVADRCGEVGTQALFAAIVNRPWRIRMVACKALLNQGTADGRVVVALEAMSHEPEAAVYDQEQAKMLETLAEPVFAAIAGNFDLESVANTLAKARAVAESDGTRNQPRQS